MSVDLDTLLSDYLRDIKLKNPNPSNDPYKDMALANIKRSAETCVDILKRYEDLKSKNIK